MQIRYYNNLGWSLAVRCSRFGARSNTLSTICGWRTSRQCQLSGALKYCSAGRAAQWSLEERGLGTREERMSEGFRTHGGLWGDVKGDPLRSVYFLMV